MSSNVLVPSHKYHQNDAGEITTADFRRLVTSVHKNAIQCQLKEF